MIKCCGQSHEEEEEVEGGFVVVRWEMKERKNSPTIAFNFADRDLFISPELLHSLGGRT